jgi:hypothetical protein
MSGWRTPENIEILAIAGILIITILLTFLLAGPELLTGDGVFFNPLLGLLFVFGAAIYVLHVGWKKKLATDATGGARAAITTKHSLADMKGWSIPAPVQPDAPSIRGWNKKSNAVRWRIAMIPASLVVIFGLGIPILLSAGLAGSVMYLIAISAVDQAMKHWGLAICLIILVAYLFNAGRIFFIIREAAAGSGIVEYWVDEDGVSFRNFLTVAQQWGLYLMAWGEMPDSLAFLTKESTHIPWSDIRAVEIHPDSLTIRVGTEPILTPIRQSILPIILLICTEENFAAVQEYIRRSVETPLRVIESS